MNKLFTILCMVTLLVFHTSCKDSVMDVESPNVEMKTRVVDQRVLHLIQRARQGDVEACNSLAICYRDGDGVDESWFNMMCMYFIYSQKTGVDIEDIMMQFDEEHPFRLLFEILDSSSFDEKTETKLEQLKHLDPAEAKAIDVVRKISSVEEATAAMCLMREIEDEGSDFAVVFQAIYYGEVEDKTGQEDCLIRFAQKYPFYNLFLGEVYVKRYAENKDFSYIQKAIECYYKADACGMLVPKYANALWGMYDYFGKKGLLEYDEQEMERLKVLAKRTY